MSDRTRCWFGAVTGHTVPMARMAVAGMRATRLSDEDIGAEHFLDRHAEPDTGLVADVCIIAVDLGTGDFCYDRILAENPQARAGVVICLDKISEFIRARTSVDGMGQ